MDARSVMYSMEVFDEIEEAVQSMGMTVQRLDLDLCKGVPTALIGFEDEMPGWRVACNVMLTHADHINTGFLQLCSPLTAPAPERRQDLHAYVDAVNEQFMMAWLSVMGDCICIKHVTALEPEEELPASHFQTTLMIFLREMELLGDDARMLASGELSLEDALKNRQVIA